jgi:D-alanyl-D-alanine carboxypeptidase
MLSGRWKNVFWILPVLVAVMLIAGKQAAAPWPTPTTAAMTATAAVLLPTAAPSATLMPTAAPTATPTPTAAPTATPKPTAAPTARPTPVTPANGITYYRGFADPRTIEPEPVADPGSLTALVNKYHALAADYVPPLVTVDGAGFSIRPEANEAWILLRAACLQDTGVTLLLISAYRSYTAQQNSFLDAIARKGIAGTVPYNALQGRSEHQLGLALDFSDGANKKMTLAFAKTSAGLWLAENGWTYGFILRYPSGKEKTTDYSYEPWHFRYIGLEPAAACHSNSWTLEEYCTNNP